jgi:hypothetical protein
MQICIPLFPSLLTVLLIIVFFTSGFQTHYLLSIAARITSFLLSPCSSWLPGGKFSILRVQMHALFTCKLQCPLVYLLLYFEASAWHCQAQVVLIYMQATKKFYITMFPELMVCVQRCCHDKVTVVSFRITSSASLYRDVVTGIWIVNYDQSSPSDTLGWLAGHITMENTTIVSVGWMILA